MYFFYQLKLIRRLKKLSCTQIDTGAHFRVFDESNITVKYYKYYNSTSFFKLKCKLDIYLLIDVRKLCLLKF